MPTVAPRRCLSMLRRILTVFRLSLVMRMPGTQPRTRNPTTKRLSPRLPATFCRPRMLRPVFWAFPRVLVLARSPRLLPPRPMFVLRNSTVRPPRSARALPPAPFLRRVAAHGIDRLVVVPVMALLFLLSEAAWIRSEGRYFVSVEVFVAAWFAGGWLVAWIGDGLRDRTFGRRLTGIRLVTDGRAVPRPLRVLLHRIVLDAVLVLILFVSLWLTMWRQGVDFGASARPLAVADFVVWLVFVANLLVGLLLLRQMNPTAGFVHDRLLGLRVVPGNLPRARPPAAEPEHAAPAARPKMALRQARTTVPS